MPNGASATLQASPADDDRPRWASRVSDLLSGPSISGPLVSGLAAAAAANWLGCGCAKDGRSPGRRRLGD